MYKVINIAASRDEGCWYHNPNGFSPNSNTLAVEPWIADMQLKLYEERKITDKQYESAKEYIIELEKNKILKVEKLEDDVITVIEPKVIIDEVDKKKSILIELDPTNSSPSFHEESKVSVTKKKGR